VTLSLPPRACHLIVRSDPAAPRCWPASARSALRPIDARWRSSRARASSCASATSPPSSRAVEIRDAPPVEARLVPLPLGEMTLAPYPGPRHHRRRKRPDTRWPGSRSPPAHTKVRLVLPTDGKELRFTVQIEPGKETRKSPTCRDQPHLVDE